MKAAVITFKKPVKILQVFCNIVYYGKNEKSFTDRKQQLEWQEMESLNGYVADQQLYLPEQILSHPRLQRCTLITIVDYQNVEDYHGRDMLPNECLVLDVPRPLGDFNLVKQEELELHLRHEPITTAVITRDGFKISNLRKGEPVEVKVNNKYDFSLFGSPRERVFKEQQYIFQYLGDYTSFQVLKHPMPPTRKRIPESRKLISLLKPLW